MSLETLNIILAGTAALSSVAGVYFSVRYNRQRDREREDDRRLMEEQLALAREQAEMRPELRVDAVRLLAPDDSY